MSTTRVEIPFDHAAAPRGLIERIAATVETWRERSAARRSLAGVSARDLRDAGLSPGQAEFELRQPFWRPLSTLRG